MSGEKVQGTTDIDLFEVDTESGRFFWKVSPRYHPEVFNKEAGCTRKMKKPYWVIKINGKAYKRSRLMFRHVHGRWPAEQVDHIDGNSLNDRPQNLREANRYQNAWNHKTRRKISKLPMGVRSVGGRFQARIACYGKMIHLGCFDTPDQASAEYQSKRREFYGEFA